MTAAALPARRALCLAALASCSGGAFVADTPPAEDPGPGGGAGIGEGESEGEGEGGPAGEGEAEAEAESESEGEPLPPGCEAAAPCTPEGGAACDLVCQTGCPAEQRCGLVGNAPRCEPDEATVPVCGYGCNTGDCAPGGVCLDASCDPGTYCYKFCRGDGDCPPGYRCDVDLNDEAGRPLGLRVCSELPYDCDAVTPQGCPVETGCYLAGVEPDGRAVTQCACNPGDGEEGADCAAGGILACRPGLVCVSESGADPTCHRACDTPRGGCPDGRLCAELLLEGSDTPLQGIGACI